MSLTAAEIVHRYYGEGELVLSEQEYRELRAWARDQNYPGLTSIDGDFDILLGRPVMVRGFGWIHG